MGLFSLSFHTVSYLVRKNRRTLVLSTPHGNTGIIPTGVITSVSNYNNSLPYFAPIPTSVTTTVQCTNRTSISIELFSNTKTTTIQLEFRAYEYSTEQSEQKNKTIEHPE